MGFRLLFLGFWNRRPWAAPGRSGPTLVLTHKIQKYTPKTRGLYSLRVFLEHPKREMPKELLGSVQKELGLWDQLPGTAPTRSRLTLMELLTQKKSPKKSPHDPKLCSSLRVFLKCPKGGSLGEMPKLLSGSVWSELGLWDQCPGRAPTRSRTSNARKNPKKSPPNFVAA